MTGPRRQTGVAIVTALLVVVLSAVLVSGVVWRIYKTSRSVQHEAARIQARQVMRSAIEWAGVILREDARVSATDTLAEPWAVPLADTRLNESLKPQVSGVDSNTSARLSGQIEDAQGRFNLFNLTTTDTTAQRQQKAFFRLCTVTGQERSACEKLVQQVRRHRKTAIRQITDLRSENTVDEALLEALKPFVVWLPVVTRVNANTAGAQVLHAVLDPLDYSTAQQLVVNRERASFKDEADLRSRSGIASAGSLNTELIDVKSQFFLVKGGVQVQESRIKVEALIQRDGNRVYTVWRTD
jgi:general secretion pathway protein K